jgi:predicted DNA-binding transcriptional regulator AlpA
MGHSAPMLLNADGLPEILTARELEGFIRIDVKTIYAYVKFGQIPYMRMGSNLRFCKREILAWLEERHYRSIAGAREIDIPKARPNESAAGFHESQRSAAE